MMTGPELGTESKPRTLGRKRMRSIGERNDFNKRYGIYALAKSATPINPASLPKEAATSGGSEWPEKEALLRRDSRAGAINISPASDTPTPKIIKSGSSATTSDASQRPSHSPVILNAVFAMRSPSCAAAATCLPVNPERVPSP